MGLFGEITGFGSGGNPDAHVLDDAAYEDYFLKAAGAISNSNAPTNDMRNGINSAALSELANLQNNAAGRKKTFSEDMARSFGANLQNRARAAGGTGNLAQALSAPGSMYDAQAREEARGYNDLLSQATRDLSTLGGV